MNTLSRSHLRPSVRAALRLLDRVVDGQNVSERAILRALEATGDVQTATTAEIGLRGYARAARLREGPNWHFDRPTRLREQRPTARATP
jgi:hypothetical protein